MTTDKIWELPISSKELMERVKWNYDGLNITITAQYSHPHGLDIIKSVIFRFNFVICQKYTSGKFTKGNYDCYDNLVEIHDSEWLNELKQMNPVDYAFLKPSHYAVYLNSEGLYQFIAKGYQIIEEEAT